MPSHMGFGTRNIREGIPFRRHYAAHCKSNPFLPHLNLGSGKPRRWREASIVFSNREAIVIGPTAGMRGDRGWRRSQIRLGKEVESARVSSAACASVIGAVISPSRPTGLALAIMYRDTTVRPSHRSSEVGIDRPPSLKAPRSSGRLRIRLNSLVVSVRATHEH